MKIDLKQLEDELNFHLDGRDTLIKQAFVHRSYVNEVLPEKIESNERLEFLGDVVLSLIVSVYIYKQFPSHKEGDLTNFRASLVKTESLAQAAKKIGLDKFILLGHGENNINGRSNHSILADTFEAFLGAIYLEFGFEKANDLVKKVLFPSLKKIINQKLYRDYKSVLQEIVQEEEKHAPAYNLIVSTGPDHDKTFTVGVYVNNKLIARGTGKNKQAAEQEAARAALEKYNIK